MKSHVTFKLPALVLLLTVASMTGFAQKLDKTLDAMIRKEYPADKPGATVLVAKEGEVLYYKAFGMANMELDVPMKPEMIFEIGSITKQFTAVCILMLMEEGKLSLDDDITKFIEDYPTHGHTITIHHLLTHTSGVKSYTEVAEIWERVRLDHSPEELIDIFKNQPMDFSPGEKYMYNNSAYFILGYIIEKVSEISYPEFIEKNIFEPLGMNNSYYGSKISIIKNRAYGYQKQDDSFANAEYFSHTNSFAAGSIMSTVDDMFIWNIAINEYKIVSKESLDKAYTNYTLNNGDPINYGYGWSLSEINGSPTLEHGGGIFGYLTNGIYLHVFENVVVGLA